MGAWLYGEPLPSDSDRQSGAACKALSSFIIAGNAALTYKGRPANMGQGNLGVRGVPSCFGS
jgi:hypothetical protein